MGEGVVLTPMWAVSCERALGVGAHGRLRQGRGHGVDVHGRLRRRRGRGVDAYGTRKAASFERTLCWYPWEAASCVRARC